MNFIDPQLLPVITLDKSHNIYLVALSLLIAILTSFTIIKTSERIHASTVRLEKNSWVIFAAFSMGIGIWATHFIGLLAIQFPVPVTYDPGLTLFSMMPVILASFVSLSLMNKSEVNYKRLSFAGIFLAMGVCAMHFIGMLAIELNAYIVFIKYIFILTCIAAFIFAVILLKVQSTVFQYNNKQFFSKKQCIASLKIAGVVSGMHYITLQAAVFIPVQQINDIPMALNTTVLSGIISFIVLLLLIIAVIVTELFRYKERAETLQKNEQELKISATSFQTNEAIMVADENMNVVRVNNAFSRITGYSELEILGQKPDFLNSGKQDEQFYKKRWETLFTEEKWSGEIWNRRKNGEIFPAWETISLVKDEGSNVTHCISFFSDITDFKLAEKEIEKLAFYDALTELPNRRLLCDRLEHELNNARRYDRAGLLFFLDLDRFKNINDSLGHSVGDELLIQTAQRLQSLLRDTDTAVRLGGDEFVILVSSQDGIRTDLLEQSSVIAEKVLNIISSPYKIGKYELFITTSIGITLFTGLDETVEQLLKRADTAMYQAKEAGRNTFRFYQQSMQEAVDIKLKIERNLRIALENNEFSLHYQPQLCDKNEVIAVEALIRWQNKELGSVSPAEFLPIAEDTGLIIAIGKWTIEMVCEQINLWEEQNIHIPQIAINISAKQFFQSGFVSMLDLITFEHSIDPNRVILEINEGVFLGNLEEAIDIMNILKERGFSFSIDDFGTGYSSLTYLKKLPFDQLKIDEAFTKDMVNLPRDLAIVKALILMAKGLGLNLIAEGVDTEQQLAYLSEFGCHNYQGYYFSKPLPAEQISEYLKKKNIRFDNI